MPAKTAAYWVSRFGVYEGDDHTERAEKELRRLGARAVPALIAGLRDKEHGWQAAKVLGEIGMPAAKKAIPALVAVVKRGTESTGDLWAARALGMLGQLDILMTLAATKRLLPCVLAGFKEARPYSYVHYEALLARNDKSLAKAISSALAPGSSLYDPPAGSFELIAAAIGSRHLALRKDAILAIVELPGLAAKKRAVPLLLPCLADRDREVRRLTLLGLGRARSAARPHVAAIRALLRDPVPLVRQFAQLALDDIGGTPPRGRRSLVSRREPRT